MKKFAILLLLVASHASILAQSPKIMVNDKDGWHKIGETTVSFDKETDKIPILGANRFSAIKIKVTDAPISLKSLDIYYGDNENKTFKIAEEIKIQGETSVAYLDGEKNIKTVALYYQTIPHGNNKKAHVEVWGYKTNSDKK